MLNDEKADKSKPKAWPLVILLGLVLLVGGFLLLRGNLEKFSSATKPTGAVDLVDADSKMITQMVKNSEGRVSLINIWATWCQPCIEEFPYLVQLKKKYPDLNLILVSADVEEDRQRVEEFLVEQGVDFRTYIKAEPDNEFAGALSKEWNGALPATFIYDGKGELKRFWIGDASLEEFSNAIESVQGEKPESTEEGPNTKE